MYPGQYRVILYSYRVFSDEILYSYKVMKNSIVIEYVEYVELKVCIVISSLYIDQDKFCGISPPYIQLG